MLTEITVGLNFYEKKYIVCVEHIYIFSRPLEMGQDSPVLYITRTGGGGGRGGEAFQKSGVRGGATKLVIVRECHGHPQRATGSHLREIRPDCP